MNVNSYVKSMLESTKESTVGLEFDMRFDVVDFIKNKLAETKLTQKQLALKMKMKDSQLTRILNAESNLTLETIARFYHAFGCRPIIVDRTKIFVLPQAITAGDVFIKKAVISQISHYKSITS